MTQKRIRELALQDGYQRWAKKQTKATDDEVKAAAKLRRRTNYAK